MSRQLKILFLEDVSADAELESRELRRGGVDCVTQRVETKEAFVRALDEFEPDVILCDFSLPTFDGLSALANVGWGQVMSFDLSVRAGKRWGQFLNLHLGQNSRPDPGALKHGRARCATLRLDADAAGVGLCLRPDCCKPLKMRGSFPWRPLFPIPSAKSEVFPRPTQGFA